jgi:hypothetical protein
MLDSRSCKQPNTTLSSTEAEHSAAVEAKPPRRLFGAEGCWGSWDASMIFNVCGLGCFEDGSGCTVTNVFCSYRMDSTVACKRGWGMSPSLGCLGGGERCAGEHSALGSVRDQREHW